jgi:hypothetical protein
MMGKALQLQFEVARQQGLSTQQKTVLYGGAVLYAFKGLKHQDVTVNYRKIGIDDAQSVVLALRRNLWSNGDLLRDGKVFVYSLAHEGTVSSKLKLDLDRSDKLALRQALTWPLLERHLRRLSRQGWESMSPERVSYLIGKALNNRDLREYKDKFAYRKHSFLESYGVSLDQAKADMLSWGLYALLKAYPRWENAGHMIAIAKTAIHNRGINIINECVSEGRQCLRKLDDGTYESLTVPWDTLATPEAQADAGSFISTSFLFVGLEGKQEETLDGRLSLQQLSKNRSFKPKQREFIRLLMGQPDEAFSSFLGTCNASAACDWEFPRYLKRVSAYLGVPDVHANEFLQSLRPLLGE